MAFDCKTVVLSDSVDCSKLLIENESLIEENLRLKARNRILVSVNRGLFDRVKTLQAELDTFFESLKEADQEAVSVVFGEIAATEEHQEA